MQTELTKITEALQHKATVCEAIARDKTEEALTGASCERKLNEQDAKAWRLKSQVWVEAETIVRAGLAGELPSSKPDATA